ncbi:unnamed protein product, partial [Tilletia laevis]
LLLFLGDGSQIDGEDDEDNDSLDWRRYHDNSDSDEDGEEDRRTLPTAQSRDRYTRSTHAQDRFEELVDDYHPGPMPRQQGGGTRLQDLTESERATVDHFQTWVEVDGTERVYSGFSKSAKKLQKNIDILSKKRALSLVKLVTGVEENTYDIIRAKFKSGMTSTYLHERGQESRDTFGTAQHVFQDWPDGEIHQHFLRNGLFDDPRYDLLMLSTDDQTPS